MRLACHLRVMSGYPEPDINRIQKEWEALFGISEDKDLDEPVTPKLNTEALSSQSLLVLPNGDAISAVVHFGSQVSIVFSLVQSAVNIALTETLANLSNTTTET